MKKREIIETFEVEISNLIEGYDSLLGDAIDSKNDTKLFLNIDATHSGRLTNDRVYPGVIVRDAAKTFVKPKNRPVLKNHNNYDDPIGRVTKSEFIQLKQGTAFENDFKRPTSGIGSGVIKLDLEIMDEDSIIKFLDKRFQEFSTRQAFDGLFCSFCGSDFSRTYCGHYPGSTVKVEAKKKGGMDKEFKVFGITGPLTYEEVSVVNIAADKYTNINKMEMSEDSADEDMIFSFKDSFSHDISRISLGSSASDTSIDLFSSGSRCSVTAKDRAALTGKTIFAMAGPDFNNINMKKTETKEETLETESTVDASSKDSTNGESNQDSTEQGTGEGVEAPKANTKDKTDETKVSDKDVADASLKALTSSNQRLEESNKELILENERVKGELTVKDEEIERLRTSTADAQTLLKESTAKQLLDNKLILEKTDVIEVTDKESYNKKLTELSKRSIESLNDALDDLIVEISSFKTKSFGSKLTDTNIANPVLEGEAKTDSKEETKKESPAQSRKKHVDSYLN